LVQYNLRFHYCLAGEVKNKKFHENTLSGKTINYHDVCPLIGHCR
jgi:hypothetical protein